MAQPTAGGAVWNIGLEAIDCVIGVTFPQERAAKLAFRNIKFFRSAELDQIGDFQYLWGNSILIIKVGAVALALVNCLQ